MISKRLERNERPVFPKKAVITAGMPYGNKNLHFGHVGGMFVHADIFARFLRDRIGKENVIFISGTDCYGSPILESYRKLKEDGYENSIEDYVRENHLSQKETLDTYNISLNIFGASAIGRSGEVHKEVSEEIFNTLFENGYIKKMSALQFYDEDKNTFLNGRQVVGKCPIAGCNSDKAYAEECSLGHQYMASELINPVSTLSGKKPILKSVDNWYFTLEDSMDIMKELNEFLKRSTNRRKYELKAIDEFLKKPLIYVPRKYIDDLVELEAKLPNHEVIDEEKKSSITFVFEHLEDRDKAKEVLESLSINYTSGKTLVPFRLSGNISWGVPVPDKDDLKDLTFWVWPESLWAPISFLKTYLESKGENPEEWSNWWESEESIVYQFIGEDNIYFYSIAEMAMLIGLRLAKGEKVDVSKLNLPHIVSNKHILFMDKKASSSSEIKPPMADELLKYYTKDQLRMHFMSLGLSSKSVGFKPQVYMKEEEKVGVDPVLKEGNLLTNVFNRLIRSCFYTLQSLNKNITTVEVSQKIKDLAEKAVFEYERHMYNQDFHRIAYVLDEYIREMNKYWTNNIKDDELKIQVVADCLYACKVIAILIHPIAPEGCEMFKEYLNIDDEIWNWDNIFEPINFYFKDGENHNFKFLEPKIDFFKKMEYQY
ncbi:class I tRNA ligase family protein [Clostridium sp. NSJ-6]|uniref:Class I tRNA ligase family protein n=1 Tax=Clostridium hominis TaxID=2763036 RepID=A0ABR7DGY9_9CLOT|nr:class I tRNA ligase family protein [Clostridium hominis]MBC5630700.1 class I tRNA ligase family protein [Clostridium hominis]MDU2670482.1 class I tRNA ligase family protein [Clostridium sp.]